MSARSWRWQRRKVSTRPKTALGIDLGGTKILALLVREDGHVLARLQRPTPAQEGRQALLESLQGIAQELLDQHPQQNVVGIGIGAPGPLDPETGLVHSMPNLAGMDNFALGPWLEEALARPVRLENDANAALLGELAFGCAQGQQHTLMLTLGTGVGGAVFSHGRIIHGACGAAGELGHITVADNGRSCGCGRLGCLETIASGPSVAARVQALGLGESSQDWLSALNSDDNNRRKKALELKDELVTGLGRALSILVNILNPTSCIIGGGLGAAAFPVLEAKLLSYVRRESFPMAGASFGLKAASLGNDAGALGAAWTILGAGVASQSRQNEA